MMGEPLPIDDETIIRYARRAGFDDPDDIDELITVLTRLDAHVLKVLRSEQDKASPPRK